MVFDTHCHTAEGSIDSIVGIKRTIKRLKEKGFDGMVITDHNSYKGHKKYCKAVKEMYKDFVVIRGIEYDTLDGGHMLIILPDGDKGEFLTKRGLNITKLVEIVHTRGGIIGPAHPYGNNRLGLGWHVERKHGEEILNLFDFIEIFNASISKISNQLAQDIATKLSITGIGGSDSHKIWSVGKVKTVFKNAIKTNNDFIKAIKAGEVDYVEGSYNKVTNSKIVLTVRDQLVRCYYYIHRGICVCKRKTIKNTSVLMDLNIQKEGMVIENGKGRDS